MDEKPALRYRQYSVAALLIVVAVCAIALGIARPWKSDTFEIFGQIDPADVKAIQSQVLGLTEEPILSMRRIDANTVEVTTGVIRGPLDGFGQILTFTKTNGSWVKTSEGFWVS